MAAPHGGPAAAPRGAEGPRRARRIRWHLLYYVLAGFDLLTVCGGIYLSHRLMGVYAESVQDGGRWAERLGLFADLGEAASRVNAPGNDVFDSHDPVAERARLVAAKRDFDAAFATARAALHDGAEHGCGSTDCALAGCAENTSTVAAGMDAMFEEAEALLALYADGRRDEAAGRMASMDRRFAAFTGHLGAVQREIRAAQRARIERQLRGADGLRKYEHVLAGLVALMIVGVTWYGHRLARIVRAAEERADREAAEREAAHRRLAEVSRRAGMAEIATGVLHNVGNVLNSVNTSARIVAESVRDLRIAQLRKAAELLLAQGDAVGRFVTEDEKGRNVPAYLGKLAESLSAERDAAVGEIDRLQAGIAHIGQVVRDQQRIAKGSTVRVPTAPAELFDEAARMILGPERRTDLRVEREYAEIGAIPLDRHKVLQILANLISNARKATARRGDGERRMTLRIRRRAETGWVQFEVEDNGVGIAPEDVAKLFRHGFTAFEDGHGFGLHSGALAAQEMRGTLVAKSEGVGTGATFTLSLPAEAAATTAAMPLQA